MAEEIPANLRDQQRRDLEIHVEARNLGPLATQKKVARATLVQRGLPTGDAVGPTYTLVSDEGAYLGGEASAPFPLAYFSSGIAF